jgi:hypothetical protein
MTCSTWRSVRRSHREEHHVAVCPMRAGYVAQDPASSDISAVGRRALGFHARARLRPALWTGWTRTRSAPRWSRTLPTCRVWPSQWVCSGLHQPRRRGAAQPGQRDRAEVVYVQNAPMRRPSPGHRCNTWRGSTGPARQRRKEDSCDQWAPERNLPRDNGVRNKSRARCRARLRPALTACPRRQPTGQPAPST